MKIQNILMAVAVMVLVAVPAVFAQTNGSSVGATNVGSNLLGTLQDLMNGNMALFIGLAVAAFGLWMWLVRQETLAGILMIIGGVLLTAAPAMFKGTRGVVAPAVDAFASGDTNVTHKDVSTAGH